MSRKFDVDFFVALLIGVMVAMIVLANLIGCSRPLPGIKEATQAEVDANIRCGEVGVVEGDSRAWQFFVPFFLCPVTSGATKATAMEDALRLEGTHVVWRNNPWKPFSCLAEGRVYRCVWPDQKKEAK